MTVVKSFHLWKCNTELHITFVSFTDTIVDRYLSVLSMATIGYAKKKEKDFFFSKKKGTTSLSLIRKVQRSFLDAQLLNVTLLLSLSCPYCQPLHIGYTLNSIQISVFPFLNLQYMHLDQNSLVPYLNWSRLLFVLFMFDYQWFLIPSKA